MKAFVFPGQGAQFVGMGKDLYDNNPIAKELFDKADEILGAMLLTEHNIMYYQDLMRGIRKAIQEHRYRKFVEEFMSNGAGELY